MSMLVGINKQCSVEEFKFVKVISLTLGKCCVPSFKLKKINRDCLSQVFSTLTMSRWKTRYLRYNDLCYYFPSNEIEIGL